MEETIFEAASASKSPFSTEFEFTLPRGYIDADGNVHGDGVMRLANAKDEIAPLSDPRVRANKAYLVILILSRVIVRLGSVTDVTPEVVEELFSADLSYLQEFYRRINGEGDLAIPASCPSCGHKFDVEFSCLGK
ncbi:MAG: phage tail assembly protein [Candidatus Zixiibacteriota bacterium]